MSPGQDERVAHANNSANNSQNISDTLTQSNSFSTEDICALLDTQLELPLTEIISAIKKLARGVKIAAKHVQAFDRLCDRLLGNVNAVSTLSSITERLDAIDEKLNASGDANKLSYAAVASLPPDVQPKRPARNDEVTIKIARNSEIEKKAQGTGEELKAWVEGALENSGVEGLGKAEVVGVQPHRSGTKVTVRMKYPGDAEKIVRCARKCSNALGEGAKVSVPHFGVVIQEVPLFIDPSKVSIRREFYDQNPHLLPSPESIVDMRWLVPIERLPGGRKTGSWVIILDSQQAADNLIDQSVKVQSLLLGARRYFTGPRQCRRCQRWGHLRYSCKAPTPACAHCAGPHESPDCPATEIKRCANCKGNHDAFFPQCPTRRTETLRAQAAQAGASVYFAGGEFEFNPFPHSSLP